MTYFKPFYSYSKYLKERYKEKVYRISVDAGFSCPNRGENRKNPGCIYCEESGSRSPYLDKAGGLKEQVFNGVEFLKKRYKAASFVLYFQAFTNTYAPLDKLRQIYDFGLSLYPFKELIISTRPDCLDAEKVKLIKGYKNADRDVWIELGLQSACDKSLKRIKRGHSVKDFLDTYKLVKENDLKITVHVIFGLPGEGWKEIAVTMKMLAGLRPDGIKIHNLHIPKQTEIYREYLKGELVVPTSLSHQSYVIKALELIPPETVIMRLTCDTVKSHLAAPLKFWDKAQFYAQLKKKMQELDTWQGRLYRPV